MTVNYLKNSEKTPIRSVIFFESNQGKGKEIRGFSLSKGDYLIGLDDDVVVPKGWLTKLVEAIDIIPNLGWLSFNLENGKTDPASSV